MSIPRITGQQARDLLDIWSGDVEGLTFAQLGADRSYGDLFGAAPALAETVAWLYGREGNEHGVHEVDGSLVGTDVYENEGRVEMESTRCDRTLTPDEAVDLARALLAAAEESRP